MILFVDFSSAFDYIHGRKMKRIPRANGFLKETALKGYEGHDPLSW